MRTAAGTDILHSGSGIGLSTSRMGTLQANGWTSAKVQVDREIELPAGVLRVAPLESTADGVIVIPEARFGNQKTRTLRLRIAGGKVVERSRLRQNAAAAREAILTANEGDRSFREFGLRSFNPKLSVQPGSPILPYFAYGAGMVRMSLGDNQELGGQVRGGGRRWFFFRDATVEGNGRVLVDRGHLVNFE